MVAVAGEQPADARLRERIDFTSNILFFIEDLYLAVGQGAITTKSGTKLDMSSSLLWVRNQLAGCVKELMIAKKEGWKVLQNLKSQVFLFYFYTQNIKKSNISSRSFTAVKQHSFLYFLFLFPSSN